MKKEELLRVRITKSQGEKVKNFCLKARIRKSEVIRNLIEQTDFEKIRIFTPEERESFENINFSLQKIGTNINQIAHFLNLEHLKGFANFETIYDILTVDKLKESQIDLLRKSMGILGSEMAVLQQKLESIYEAKK